MRLDSLQFAYPGGDPIFQELSHTFEREKVHGIIGPSGCGKTTLLYLISELLQPDSGSIEIPGSVEEVRTAIILQDYGLFPWKRVGENIGLGLKIQGRDRKVIRRLTDGVMEELGISHLRDSYPQAISGGERQRVAIARTLVLNPSILLMDEPFSSLDAMKREQMQELLLRIQEAHHMTVLMVTHSIEEAAFLSDEVHLMEKDPENGISSFTRSFSRLPGTLSRTDEAYFQQVRTIRSALKGGLEV